MTETITKGVRALAGTQHKKPLILAARFEDLSEDAAALMRLVSEDFDVTHDQLLSEGRGTQYVAKARQVLMWAYSSLLGMNMGRIGGALGRDRSSAHHGVEYVNRVRQADGDASVYLETLKARWMETVREDNTGEDMI